MNSNLDLKCGGDIYHIWTIGVVGSITLLFGILYPIYLFARVYKAYKNKENIDSWY